MYTRHEQRRVWDVRSWRLVLGSGSLCMSGEDSLFFLSVDRREGRGERRMTRGTSENVICDMSIVSGGRKGGGSFLFFFLFSLLLSAFSLLLSSLWSFVFCLGFEG